MKVPVVKTGRRALQYDEGIFVLKAYSQTDTVLAQLNRTFLECEHMYPSNFLDCKRQVSSYGLTNVVCRSRSASVRQQRQPDLHLQIGKRV